MSRYKPTLFPFVLMAVLVVFFLGTPSVGAASAAHTPLPRCGSWQVVPSPDIGLGTNILLGVAGVSADNVWAVGYHFNTNTPTTSTLVEHWNGSNWQVVKSPNGGMYLNYLAGVAAVSANDIWAVGFSLYSASSPFRTLIEHWNGRNWSVIKSPNPGWSATLSAVSFSSSASVWAVGDYAPPKSANSQTLVEHWNGSSWQVVNSPNPGTTYNMLSGVTAISDSDVWAVGQYNVQSFNRTLVEHWNGSTWQAVKSPNQGADSALFAVAATFANNVWAVGNQVPGNYHTLTEQWNGSGWRVGKSPNVGTDNGLFGVAAISANNIWAVGVSGDYIQNTFSTLVEHWNGSQWQVVASVSPGSVNNELNGVAAISGSGIWAVGAYRNSGHHPFRTLIEFYC